MDSFTYALKVQELKRLTTKKSKADFIRDNKVRKWNSATYFKIKLLIDIYNTITDDTISGVRGLSAALNNCIQGLAITNLKDKDVEELLKIMPNTKCNVHNAYYEFMSSSGIPAYLKLVVLKAQHEEQQC